MCRYNRSCGLGLRNDVVANRVLLVRGVQIRNISGVQKIVQVDEEFLVGDLVVCEQERHALEFGGPGGSAPRGANARRSLHKPLPHLNLPSASRRQAQCVPRAPCLQGPGHERTETQKQPGTKIARQDRPPTVPAHS